MLTLLDNQTTPSGGFRFFEARTKTWIDAPTLLDLTRLVITHRHGNQLPGDSNEDAVAREVQDQLCRTLPPGQCRDLDGEKVISGRPMSFEAIKQGTATLLAFIVNGAKKVDKVTANARAKTCAGCYANRDPSGECTTCTKAAFAAATTVIGAEPTDYDGYLKACAYCACGLKAKVWVPLDIVRNHTPHEQFAQLPPHCWIRTE